jgi:hypothetical protein
MTITGSSESRLSELKTFARQTTQWSNYKQSSTPLNDGVNARLYIPFVQTVYYIDGITYKDTFVLGEPTTFFSFEKTGINEDDFITAPIYKDPNKENIISNPKVLDDVFIVRQEISAFNDNYKLEFVKTLNQLVNYAGGNYFNIVNNT